MKKPNKKELAALLQTMIILSGNRTSLTKGKHNLIESVCKKYDFYPDILEITSVDPYEIFSTIAVSYTHLEVYKRQAICRKKSGTLAVANENRCRWLHAANKKQFRNSMDREANLHNTPYPN